MKSNQTAVDLPMKLYAAGQTEFLNLLTTEHNLHTSDDVLVQADRTIDSDLMIERGQATLSLISELVKA